jgi:hypothetical protein
MINSSYMRMDLSIIGGQAIRQFSDHYGTIRN